MGEKKHRVVRQIRQSLIELIVKLLNQILVNVMLNNELKVQKQDPGCKKTNLSRQKK